MRTEADKRAPGVEAYMENVFQTPPGSVPELPLNLLRRATSLLLEIVHDDGTPADAAKAVADEFILRLELRYRGVENCTHVAEALRFARESLDQEFPTVH
jgi:hypothetical protein